MSTAEGLRAVVDLRSDTVTQPGSAMRRAMAEADVGDDVYGEDPTVNELERRSAELLGKEAALFVSSGTQGNLIGLLSQTTRGDEIICGDASHTFVYESGGAAALGGIHPRTLRNQSDGTLALRDIVAAIRPKDVHHPPTRLISLENTFRGRPLPPAYLEEVGEIAETHGLKMHLDGARLFNAAVASDVEVRDLVRRFDTVTFCLSKGLGAPVGSVLCGTRGVIDQARRWRKMLGGGMRQGGVLAAAGLLALDEGIERLVEDHRRARALAEGFEQRVELNVAGCHTNMVFADVPVAWGPRIADDLRERGVLISLGARLGDVVRSRFVLHRDIDDNGVERALEAFVELAKEHRAERPSATS